MNSVNEILTLGVLFFSLYFEVFMLITYIEHSKTIKERGLSPVKNHPELPSVTIIVPCFNEEMTAGKTIESLLAVDYPKDKLHIMAINDGSTDNTRSALDAYADNPQIKVIHKTNGGKHTVLNVGIGLATTDFIGCLDADSYVKPDSLLRLMKRFENPKVMAVIPSLHVLNAKTIIEKMQKVEYLIGIFLRTVLAELNALYVTPGPLSVFRKEVFIQIGSYKKAHNGEDMEMALRMQVNNMKIAKAHDAIVYTSAPSTIPKLYKQRVRWLTGFINNVRDYRHILLNTQYGHIGGFVLPMMIFAVAGMFFFMYTIGYSIILDISSSLTHFQAIGFKMFEWSWPTMTWFFVHTSVVNFTILFALIMILTIITIGTLLSKGNRPNIIDILCYMFLYTFISPFWFMKSFANIALSKQTIWR